MIERCTAETVYQRRFLAVRTTFAERRPLGARDCKKKQGFASQQQRVFMGAQHQREDNIVGDVVILPYGRGWPGFSWVPPGGGESTFPAGGGGV